MDDRSGTKDSDDNGMPRWVKVSAIVALLLAVVVAVVLFVGGGDHGPGRHSSDGVGQPMPILSAAVDRVESADGDR